MEMFPIKLLVLDKEGPMHQPRALVTGLSSSLALGIALELRNLGFHVVGVTRHRSRDLEIAQEEVNWMDPSDWKRESFDAPFDFVFHGAAQRPGVTQFSHFEINYEIPLAFFSQIRLFPWTKFVFSSTTSVYTPRVGEIINECTDPIPKDEYAMSKLAFENEISSVLLSRGSAGHALILRIPTLLGRNVSRNLVHRWCEAVLDGSPIRVTNPDDKFDALVSENDLVRRIVYELGRQETFKYIVNCHTNGDVSILESARIVSHFFQGLPPITIEDSTSIPTHLTNQSEDWFTDISTAASLRNYLMALKFPLQG